MAIPSVWKIMNLTMCDNAVGIHFAQATAQDASKLLEYLKRVGGESDNLSFGSEGLPFSVDAEAALLQSRWNSEDDLQLLAMVGSEIIGIASLSRLSRRMSHRGTFAISVRKDFWGQGIGSALTGRVLSFARAHRFEQIDLEVRSDNFRAIHLYQKFGFQKLCTYPGFFKIRGKKIDFDLMYLTI